MTAAWGIQKESEEAWTVGLQYKQELKLFPYLELLISPGRHLPHLVWLWSLDRSARLSTLKGPCPRVSFSAAWLNKRASAPISEKRWAEWGGVFNGDFGSCMRLRSSAPVRYSEQKHGGRPENMLLWAKNNVLNLEVDAHPRIFPTCGSERTDEWCKQRVICLFKRNSCNPHQHGTG